MGHLPSEASWRRRRAYSALLAAAVCSMVAVSSAQAAPVTVGQLFPPHTPCSAVNTYLQTGASSGNSYTVPVSGQITSWSFEDDATPVTGLKLKVARPAGTNTYTIIGERVAPTQTPSSVNTAPASIPVRAGDIIGISEASGDCGTQAGTSGDSLATVATDAPLGSTMTYTPEQPGRFPVSVSVQPTPGVTAITPSSGSAAGGATVTISGQNFAGTTAVSFGGTPAKSFTVLSDNVITAVTPASSAGTVDVTVKNPGQSATVATDRFTFTTPAVQCVVPKLKGKKLKAVKQALKNAHCKLGKVKRHGHKKGKVKKQSPKAGTVLAAGSKVGLTLRK